MAGFQYQHGDQPLAGYTIQHAVGRGGFGEVYYAVSESGREVALKVIKGYEQIEIRGVSQCMNLKSPHLVSIFDIKHADDGTPFVIMEYVAGPSLRELLNDAPSGLGVQKAAFFLREIAKGLTYLHDRGIVHRDLKPGNIFYEDGYVKIGDYGLSKAISASMHSGQTITVGSVHYMAPEVGQGRYDRGIDVYALGVLLYEMLTGQVPYFGSSHGEILMKHLTAAPDVSNIEEPFAHVIKKALAKDPAERYASVQEMVEAVFGAAHIQESVSHFAPESLSMIAGRAAAKVGIGDGSSGQHALGGGFTPPGDASDWKRGPQDRLHQSPGAQTVGHVRQEEYPRVTSPRAAAPNAQESLPYELGRFVGEQVYPQSGSAGASPMPVTVARKFDPLSNPARTILGLLTAIVLALGATVIHLAQYRFVRVDEALPRFLVLNGLLLLGVCFGLSVAQRFLAKFLHNEGWLVKRIAYTTSALVAAFLPGSIGIMLLYESTGWGAPREEYIVGSLLAMGVSLALVGWDRCMYPLRRERIVLRYAIWAGGLALVCAWLFNGFPFMACGVMAGVALCVQLFAPFVPAQARAAAWSAVNAAPPASRIRTRAGNPPTAQHAAASPPPPPLAASPRKHTHAAPHGSPPPVAAYGDPREKYTSPRRRLWALLFSLAPCAGVPVFGLHRFYAGKIGTGILWLCTFGFLWIGQIIDVILIACGNFRDKEGRPVTIWTDESAPRPLPPAYPGERKVPVHEPHSEGERVHVNAEHASGEDRPFETPRHPRYDMPPATGAALAFSTTAANPVRRFMTNRPLAFLAFLLLAWACVTGAFKFLEVPDMMAANVFGADLPRDLTRGLGYEQWPNLLENMAVFLCNGALLLGAFMLMVARRRAGIAHMGRAVLGVLLLGFCLYAFDANLSLDASRINVWVQEERIGPLLEYLLAQFSHQSVLMTTGVLLAVGVLLAWPERERFSSSPGDVKEVA